MSPTSYIYAHVHGAWLLVKGKPEGAAYMDWSVSGFWKSFWAILVCLPLLFGEWAIIESRPETANGGDPVSFVALTMAYLSQWVLYPVLLYFLSGPMNLRATYIPYIISYNWFGVLTMLIQAPVMMMILLDLNTELTMLIYLVSIVVIIFALTRLALQVAGASVLNAIGLVVMDILIGFLVDRALF